jgi:transposase
MNELSVTEEETIRGLLQLRWSHRRIARETGHHRATIQRVARAMAIAAASEEPKPATDAKVATDLDNAPGSAGTAVEARADDVATGEVVADGTTETAESAAISDAGREIPGAAETKAAKRNAQSVGRSSCEAHRSFIEAETVKGRNSVAIFQDLVEHHGYEGAYNAVKRFVRKIVPSEQKVSCRFETPRGQESQVDYGEGAPTLHSQTGKYRKPRLFVLSLGCSRHAFRKVVWKSSKEIWCALHEEAFAYFGGVTKTIRLDNLREGVIDPDIYDPELNPLYADLLKHYGVVAIPCRPYAPDLKGKVESAVGYTQRTGLAGRRFETIDEQNTHLYHWNDRWAATRIHGTTKRQVREMFEEERPFLAPLPATRFEYYRTLERRAHYDGHIEVDGAYYSVPARYIGSTVVVRVGRLWVRVIDPIRHECIREHPVALTKGSRRTVDADRPKQTPPQVQRLVAKIAAAGPSCGAFAKANEVERGADAMRTLFGLLDLLRKHPVNDVESACALALSAGTTRLRFVRTFLTAVTPPQLTDEHRLIAPIKTYTTHFETLMQGELPLD